MIELPEPLFESYYMEGKHVCLVCGKNGAKSMLRSVESGGIVPMCVSCSKGWNFHGYYILKRTKPRQLFWNIFLYKLSHWNPSWLSIWSDISKMRDWAKKNERIKAALFKK